jgi:predicted RNase H-like nuclease (RuvC/YqgF family)
MKKEHFEILLENMDSKFKLVLEGHAALDKKIENLRQENKEEHRLLHQMITEVNRKVDSLDQKVDNLAQENEIAHKEILSGIKLSYSELDSRIKYLEQEISNLNQRVTRLETTHH